MVLGRRPAGLRAKAQGRKAGAGRRRTPGSQEQRGNTPVSRDLDLILLSTAQRNADRALRILVLVVARGLLGPWCLWCSSSCTVVVPLPAYLAVQPRSLLLWCDAGSQRACCRGHACSALPATSSLELGLGVPVVEKKGGTEKQELTRCKRSHSRRRNRRRSLEGQDRKAGAPLPRRMIWTGDVRQRTTSALPTKFQVPPFSPPFKFPWDRREVENGRTVGRRRR